jgi:hypothetical protein
LAEKKTLPERVKVVNRLQKNGDWPLSQAGACPRFSQAMIFTANP